MRHIRSHRDFRRLRHRVESSQTREPTTGERTAWIQLTVVSAASFVVWTGFGAIIPFLPIFLREETHSSMLMIGVIASMFYVGTLLFSSPLGWLSDTIGRKPVIVCGVALYTLSMFLFTTTREATWFVVFRLFEGIGAAAVGPAGQAFIADITHEKDRSKAYGVLTTAQFGGLVIGPALASPIYYAFGGGVDGFRAIFLAGAIGAACVTLGLFLLIREPICRSQRPARTTFAKSSRPPYRQLLTPAILAFVLIAFTNHFSMGAFEVVWSIRLLDIGASLSFISLTFIVFSVPMLLSFAGGMLADRYSRFVLTIGGFTVAACAWLVYGLTENLQLILVASAVEGLAVAFSYPAKQAFFMQVSPAEWRGTLVGFENTSTQLSGLVGTLVAPAIYGWIAGQVLTLAGSISLLGLAVAAPILRHAWHNVAPQSDTSACD
ncbi:MAG: MFS transporter [Thermoleophilia bacterium]